jgi:hypothetical protein
LLPWAIVKRFLHQSYECHGGFSPAAVVYVPRDMRVLSHMREQEVARRETVVRALADAL